MFYRVEVYEGCALWLSQRFETEDEANQWRESLQAVETRLIKVNSDGAAV
jgi:hypothetical protein